MSEWEIEEIEHEKNYAKNKRKQNEKNKLQIRTFVY